MSNQFCTVIMGDLIGSRLLDGKGRYQAQLFLKSTLIQINENYKNMIEAPFMISKGDEFQGVIQNPEGALNIINDLERILFPLYFRFGLGMGTFFKMGGSLPIEMDGQAFHRASKSLQVAKKKKLNIVIFSGIPVMDELLNQMFILIQAIKSRWKENHFAYYWDFKEIESIKKIAELRGISSQAVSEQIRKLHIREIIYSEQTIRNTLHELIEYKPI